MKVRSLLAFLALILTACDELAHLLPPITGCSGYNKALDDFRLSVEPSTMIADVGSAATLEVERSWLNDDLERVSLNCKPEWVYEPQGIAQVSDDNREVTAVAVGVAKVTARVTGAGGTKTDSFWVAVRPQTTEAEPNNGIAAANGLSSAHYGRVEYSGDTDFFYLDVPSGKGFQITLGHAPQVSTDDPFNAPSYQARLYLENGDNFGEVNKAYRNDTGMTLRIFVGISGHEQAFPYSLSASIF